MAQAGVTAGDAAQPAPRASPGEAGGHFAVADEARRQRRELTVVVVTVVAVIYFSLRASSFYSVDNVVVLVQYVAPVMVIGAGEVLMLVLAEMTCRPGGLFDVSLVCLLGLDGGIPIGLAIVIALAPVECSSASSMGFSVSGCECPR